MVIHKRFNDSDEEIDVSPRPKSATRAPPSSSAGFAAHISGKGKKTPTKTSETPDKSNARPEDNRKANVNNDDTNNAPSSAPPSNLNNNNRNNHNHNNNNNKSNGPAKTKSISAQIRALERLLKNKKNNLPPLALASKQAKLTQLKRMANERGRRKHEFKASRKYHMIKFFERRKIERLLDKESDHLKKIQLERDLNYVLHFPKDRKYIALFPKAPHSDEMMQTVNEIKDEIATAMSTSGNAKDSVMKNDGEEVSEKEKKDMEKDDFFI